LDQDEKTVDAALRAAERLYDEEDARFRQSEQKATALLAVAGVLLGVLSRQPPTGTDNCFGLVLRTLSLVAFLALAVGIAFGLIVLSPRTAFKRVKPGDLASDATLALSPEKFKRAILERYSEAITASSKVTERKFSAVWWSLRAVSLGLSLMFLAGILQLAR